MDMKSNIYSSKKESRPCMFRIVHLTNKFYTKGHNQCIAFQLDRFQLDSFGGICSDIEGSLVGNYHKDRLKKSKKHKKSHNQHNLFQIELFSLDKFHSICFDKIKDHLYIDHNGLQKNMFYILNHIQHNLFLIDMFLVDSLICI